MLTELRIHDFAVVGEASLEFGPGLTVLTGETGAGKSIIVDALTTALGARASADAVRSGAAAARVEVRLAVAPETAAAHWLAAQGLEDDDLVIAREIASDGRSRAWINGRASTVGMLRELGELLVEVVGQHESQRLLRPQTHLELLDLFGGPSVVAERDAVAALVARRAALRAEQQTLRDGERERLRRIDLLRHQVGEITAARLQPGEEEALAGRRTRLLHAERLATAAGGAYAALYEADGGAAVDRLGQARAALREAVGIDPALAVLVQRVEGLAGELAEVAHELAAYRERLEDRPDELEGVEERLALLHHLRRKYGETVEAVLAYGEEAAAELGRLDAGDARLAQIAGELAALEDELGGRCARLSRLRREAADRLDGGVAEQLRALEMRRARLHVSLTREADPEGVLVDGERLAVGPAGSDRVEFLLAANPGEGPRPLARVASGGELARVMLALRHVLAATGGVPVMVCDEVDAGIGARAAGAVGSLLAAAARSRQVLCVTHLAQIASLGDRHYWVTKDVVRGRTHVRVHRLGPRERVEEIARMLSGRTPTATAREHAEELLGGGRRSGGARRGS